MKINLESIRLLNKKINIKHTKNNNKDTSVEKLLHFF